MYKKITHDIVEEHFDHPMASQLKHQMDNKKLIPKLSSYYIGSDYSVGLNDPLPQYVLNENTMLFRMDCRTAWNKWVYSLLNYSVSLNGNLPGTDQVKGRMHKNAVAIGDMLIPYYGPTAGKLVGTSLIAIDDIGMHYVEALKNNEPTEEIVASWVPFVNDFAKILNELNPNNWPAALITDILLAVVKAWQDQLTARAVGDIIADEIAIDLIAKLVVTGIPDHGKGFDSLADVFSRGIIAQFPSMFQD
jgi:hypothetical protein